MSIKRFQTPPRTFREDEEKGTLKSALRYITKLEDNLTYIFGEILNLLNKRYTGTATWNPGSINNGAQSSTDVTVTGAAVGDPAFAGFSPVTAAGWVISAVVTAENTVKVTLVNHTGGAVDLASGTVTAIVWKG